MRLEDSLVDQSYVDVNLISDADLVYGENLVDADGDRILIDAMLHERISFFRGWFWRTSYGVCRVRLAQTFFEDGSGLLGRYQYWS